MKRFLCLALIFVVCSFAACKKAEETPEQGKKQNAEMKESGADKRRARKGAGPAALQIYQEDKLVATVPATEYAKMTTTSVKVDGKEYKAILLTDLLKKYNVTGKTVTLKGPAKESSINWQQVTANPIYVYVFKNRLQLYTDSKGLETIKLPIVLVRVVATEKPPAAVPGQPKGTKKGAT